MAGLPPLAPPLAGSGGSWPVRQDQTSPGTCHSALLWAGSPPHPRSPWRPSAGPVWRTSWASWALRGQHLCLAQGTPGTAPGQPSHSRPLARWAPAGAFWDDGLSPRPHSGPSRWSSLPPPPWSGTWQSRGSVLRKEAKSISGGPLGPGAQKMDVGWRWRQRGLKGWGGSRMELGNPGSVLPLGCILSGSWGLSPPLPKRHFPVCKMCHTQGSLGAVEVQAVRH